MYFTLQGRMEPILAGDGSLSKAMVYTAFEAKENGSDVVQVRKIWGIQKYWLSYICGGGAHGNSMNQSFVMFLWCSHIRTAKHVFHCVTRSDVMTTANTKASFGFRDAGKDILKVNPLVKLALISFMDVMYQSYVKLHWVIFYYVEK